MDTHGYPAADTFPTFLQYYRCAMVKSRNSGDGHPTFNRNPYNGYINPYYWVDDHPLLYGNNGSLDPGTYELDHEMGLENDCSCVEDQHAGHLSQTPLLHQTQRQFGNRALKGSREMTSNV